MDIWKWNDEKQKELCVEKAWKKGKQKMKILLQSFLMYQKRLLKTYAHEISK